MKLMLFKKKEQIRDAEPPPFPALIEQPRDKLEAAIAWFIAEQMRAVIYTRAAQRAITITKEKNLATEIFKPEDFKIQITYEIEINASAILAGLAALLSERGSFENTGN
jgi:hypothetical protein